MGITLPLQAQPSNWKILKFPGPSGPVDRTWCLGVNPRGHMVGYWAGQPDRGFVLRDGVFTAIDVPGARWTHPWGINARGDIVGDYGVPGGMIRGFKLSGGVFTEVDYPGVFMTHPRDISPNGDIVGGHMMTATSPWVGIVIGRHGGASEFRFPGAVSTLPFGINAQGAIVGEFRDAMGKFHGFVRSPSGTFAQLDVPGASYTSAWKVNERGDVVGYYWDSATPAVSHGFVYKDGLYSTLDVPGAAHTMIHGLNSEGEMCGMVSLPSTGTGILWGGFSRTW